MILLNLAARIAAAVLNIPPDALAFLPMAAPIPYSPLDAARRSASDRAMAKAWSDDRIGYRIPEEDAAFVDASAAAAVKMMAEAGSSSYDASAAGSISSPIHEDDGEVDLLEAALSRPSTYGEVTALGARQLYGYMGMAGPYRRNRHRRRPYGGNILCDDDDNDDDENDKGDDSHHGHHGGSISFLDMGSGTGRLVVQSYMELPRLRRSVGVELSPTRHAAAERAWETLLRQDGAAEVDEMTSVAHDVRRGGGKSSIPEIFPDATVKLSEGDLFDVDVSDATHVYVASLCFTADMMLRLANKLTDEGSMLRCVATLKPFPTEEEGGSARAVNRLGLPRMEYVEMSWTRDRGEGCSVYFYDLKRQ